ncbi:MAG: C40 family peptidase, partial [Myxococcales bacterium]|nr:C40 family peptidase [Myxococcales bacterium]
MLRFSLLALSVAIIMGCGGRTIVPARIRTARSIPAPPRVPMKRTVDRPICPAEADAPPTLPNVQEKHLRLRYWLERLGKEHKLDEPLLTPAQVRDLNAGISIARKGYHPQLDLLAPIDAKEYAANVKARTNWALTKLATGEYVSRMGGALSASQLADLRRSVSLDSLQPTLHVALGHVALRCFPLVASIHSKSPETRTVNTRYDRNACSTAHSQEVVQVIARWPNGMRLARTRYAFGWIAKDAPLSPPIPLENRNALVRLPRLQLVGTDSVELEDGQRIQLREGILLPPAGARRGERRVLVATKAGLRRSKPLEGSLIRPTARILTRRSLLTEAWRYLNTPYGLGGVGNGRDCSRFLLDLFESFNIKLPRFSGWQALAGSFSIDVTKATEGERSMLIESAAKRGIVLLHFPGHIMMYLGRDDAGKPMALHAFGEYLKPCAKTATTGKPTRAETLMRVKKVTVSDLELGRGTSRKAFIERITRITVIGKTAGRALAGVAELRPPAPIVVPKRRCRDSYHDAIWVSPERPYRTAPMRVIASSSDDPGPVEMVLVDPDGKRHTPRLVRLGGPPYGLVARVDKPKPGRWRAIVGDGKRIVA